MQILAATLPETIDPPARLRRHITSSDAELALSADGRWLIVLPRRSSAGVAHLYATTSVHLHVAADSVALKPAAEEGRRR